MAKPTNKEVDKLHTKYMENLTTLFNSHRDKYGVPQETKLKPIGLCVVCSIFGSSRKNGVMMQWDVMRLGHGVVSWGMVW